MNVQLLNLFEIKQQIKSGKMVRPEWQREDVWAWNSIEEWLKTIKEGGDVDTKISTGVLIDDKEEKKYIIDGVQRIYYGLIHITEQLRQEGLTENKINEVLKNVRVIVAEKTFNNVIESIEHFRKINTHLYKPTTKELIEGIIQEKIKELDLMTFQKTAFNITIGEIIDEAVHRLTTQNGKKDVNNGFLKRKGDTFAVRQTAHKRYRDDKALFARFCDINNIGKNYEVVSIKFPYRNLKHYIGPEEDCLNAIHEMGSKQLEKQLALFKNQLNNFCALFQEIKEKSNLNSRFSFSDAWIRWYFNFMINKAYHYPIPREDMEKFILWLMKNGEGTTTIKVPNQTTQILGLQKTHHYSILSKLSGIKLESENFKRLRGLKLEKGFDNHHPDPFALKGNGKTVPLSASKNRSEGNKISKIKNRLGNPKQLDFRNA